MCSGYKLDEYNDGKLPSHYFFQFVSCPVEVGFIQCIWKQQTNRCLVLVIPVPLSCSLVPGQRIIVSSQLGRTDSMNLNVVALGGTCSQLASAPSPRHNGPLLLTSVLCSSFRKTASPSMPMQLACSLEFSCECILRNNAHICKINVH